jgi:hypothetical protein
LPDIPFQAAGFAVSSEALPNTAQASFPAPEVQSSARDIRLPSALDSALRDPSAAGSVVLALLLQRSGNANPRQLLDACVPDRAAFVLRMADSLAAVPSAAQLSILDLAMPVLKGLARSERNSLLNTVARLIEHDGRVNWHEFVLQTILVRRLGPQAGRAVPFRFARAVQIRNECALLLSLLAMLSYSGMPSPPEQELQTRFLRAATHLPELELSHSDLHAASAMKLSAIRHALEQANGLMPLAKPDLIKALSAVCETDGSLPPACADTLRAICSAIDAPLPPSVFADAARNAQPVFA